MSDAIARRDGMTAPVPSPNWTHPGTVLRVIDGDTMLVRLDFGRYWGGMTSEASGPIRVAGLYCPELDTPEGRVAKITADDLLMRPSGYGRVLGIGVVVATRKPNPHDPYGRVVADVWLPDGRSYADVMIAAGQGKATP